MCQWGTGLEVDGLTFRAARGRSRNEGSYLATIARRAGFDAFSSCFDFLTDVGVKLLTYSSDFGAARLDACELPTVVPYTYTLSERSAELHGLNVWNQVEKKNDQYSINGYTDQIQFSPLEPSFERLSGGGGLGRATRTHRESESGRRYRPRTRRGRAAFSLDNHF
ncbi:hypothetical protein EVAR_95759_1 [Eumeta japonica]|uniref:Uncharacterized protein n=1 Tax=Eumeta variegata TaxID=151549 RepID=A0A4C1UKI0_EUMVA|nr:hypothetical protein EVAR_95759_1 [Eumeta japonica]